MSDTKIKAKLYIDGNFTVHIYKYLLKRCGKAIDWKSFQEYVKDKISKEENKICTLESQFFVGTGLETTDKDRDVLFNSMEHEGIVKHATPLKKKASGGLKEDAVDTNLVFFATQDYYKREQYDYLVLLAGDSDFVPLVKGLAAEAVKTFVIYMDFEDKELGKTQTAQALLDETQIREDINSLLLERVDEKIKKIFINTESPANKESTPVPTKSVPKTAEENNSENKKSEHTPKVYIVKKQTPKMVESSPKIPIKIIKSDSSSKEISSKLPVSTNNLPFSKDQLINAIKITQESKCEGKNDYVLVAQVGVNLKNVVGGRLHGKLYNMIRDNFPDDFEFDVSSKDAPTIRIKENNLS